MNIDGWVGLFAQIVHGEFLLLRVDVPDLPAIDVGEVEVGEVEFTLLPDFDVDLA